MKTCHILLTAALVLAAPLQAIAGGFILPSTGARAAGMGGAFVAQGDDLSILDYNPAQLVRLDGYQFQAHYTGYLFAATFDPAPVAGLGGGEAASNSADFLNHIPNVYFSAAVGDDWHIGLGVFTPYGPRHTYTDFGAQRYQVQQSKVQLAWPTIAVAYRILENFSASLSLDIAYVNAEQKFALGLIPGFRSLDGSLLVTGSGVQTPRPKLGLLYGLTEEMSLGFVALPGMDLKIKGRVAADVPQVGFTPEKDYDDIVATQRAPTELRLGYAYQPERWRSEVTVRYYRWSEYTAQTIDLKRNKIGDFDIPDISMEKLYQDTFAFQVGGGYEVVANHEVRLGYTYDMQAAQKAGLAISDFDAPKHIVGAGYGTTFGRYSLDLGYNHVFYEPQEVTNSVTTPIAVLGTAPNLGNGTYSWSVDTFMIAMGVSL